MTKIRRFLLLPLMSALVLVAGAEPAFAYKIGGARWSGRPATITYFEATPKAYHEAITMGARAWNTSGIAVRFVRVTSRSRARMVITQDASIAPNLGYASIGFQSRSYIKLTGCQRGCDRFSMGALVAHEMGHVLGLGHEQRRCSIMNSVELYGTCRPKQPRALWQWRCRMLQLDDLAGAKALYGGRPRIAPSEFCEKQPKPPAVSGLTATALAASPAIPAQLTWNNPSKLITGVFIQRKVGGCPTSRSDGEYVHPARGFRAATDESMTPLPAGPICYRVWTLDEFGRTGASASVTLAYPGAPAAPPPTSISLAEVSSPITRVQVTATIMLPTVSWLAKVELRRALGACPDGATGTMVGVARITAAVATIDDTTNTEEGAWCYAAFTIDQWGRRSTIGAVQWINHVPARAPAPTGASGSVDDGGVGHVSWNWPGDGLGMMTIYRAAGACPGTIVVDTNTYIGDVTYVQGQPSATFDDYGVQSAEIAAGQYCYALVGTDANGLRSSPVGVTLSYP